MVLSAKKRGTVFASRRQRRQAEPEQASQPKPADPTPAEPNPQPDPAPQPRAVKYGRGSASADVVETPDVATVAEPETPQQPLGDLREVAELAEAAQGCTCGPGDGCTTDGCEGTPLASPDPADAPRAATAADDSEPEPKRGRGRPRPQETIDRDSNVHRLLVSHGGGLSKTELAEMLDEKEQQVYSSLRQLSKDGRAKTGHVKGTGWRWFAV